MYRFFFAKFKKTQQGSQLDRVPKSNSDLDECGADTSKPVQAIHSRHHTICMAPHQSANSFLNIGNLGLAYEPDRAVISIGSALSIAHQRLEHYKNFPQDTHGSNLS